MKFRVAGLWKTPSETLIRITLNLQINVKKCKIIKELFSYPETLGSSILGVVWYAAQFSSYFVVIMNEFFFLFLNWLLSLFTKDHVLQYWWKHFVWKQLAPPTSLGALSIQMSQCYLVVRDVGNSNSDVFHYCWYVSCWQLNSNFDYKTIDISHKIQTVDISNS
jgi:hypothetical protein